MKPIKTFIIGSRTFFMEMEGYVPKDYDELNIMDRFPFKGNVLNMKMNGKDVFFFRDMDKEGFIKDTLECGVPMRVGKFLVPEFAEYLGMTIADLKRLSPVIENIDEKHHYEKAIYDAYLENQAFYLNEKQRAEAYKEYLKKK